MGPRIKPHETNNKDDLDRPAAYNSQGVGGTPTIRAYLTQNRNRTWNPNTLQMYTYWTRGHPYWHAPTCYIPHIVFANFPAGTVTIGSRRG